jgi:hypothetical protein
MPAVASEGMGEPESGSWKFLTISTADGGRLNPDAEAYLIIDTHSASSWLSIIWSSFAAAS